MTDDSGTPERSWEEQVARLPGLLNVEEAAIILRMHPTTVRQLAAAGEIPATKLGAGRRASWRISKKKLLQQLQVELDEDDSDD